MSPENITCPGINKMHCIEYEEKKVFPDIHLKSPRKEIEKQE